ncbi:MAG: (2Fe-2S)-binding protein [bacterium]|nr:(2Fe-2S)-binding protein [bacterium]
MSETMPLQINGKMYQVDTDRGRSLLNVLREDLDLTGSKYGCGEGQCGSCTVLIDGAPTRSCITPVGDAEGRQVLTVEGLEENGRLHPVQEAFLEVGAMQCGYCTAGMIMSGVALLQKYSEPAPQEIAGFMQGNICRCGTYSRVIEAVGKAAQAMKGGRNGR